MFCQIRRILFRNKAIKDEFHLDDAQRKMQSEMFFWILILKTNSSYGLCVCVLLPQMLSCVLGMTHSSWIHLLLGLLPQLHLYDTFYTAQLRP